MTRETQTKTVTLSKTTFDELMTSVEFFLGLTEETLGYLEGVFVEANSEHPARFRLADIRANKLIIEKLMKRVWSEAKQAYLAEGKTKAR